MVAFFSFDRLLHNQFLWNQNHWKDYKGNPYFFKLNKWLWWVWYGYPYCIVHVLFWMIICIYYIFFCLACYNPGISTLKRWVSSCLSCYHHWLPLEHLRDNLFSVVKQKLSLPSFFNIEQMYDSSAQSI